MFKWIKKILRGVADGIDGAEVDMAMRDLAGILGLRLKGISGICYKRAGLEVTVHICMPILNREERRKAYRVQDEIIEKYPELTFDFWMITADGSGYDADRWGIIKIGED